MKHSFICIKKKSPTSSILVGNFTNIKGQLYPALNTLVDLNNYYIQGKRAKKRVTQNSLGSSFENKSLVLYDFDTEKPVFLIYDVPINKVNYKVTRD